MAESTGQLAPKADVPAPADNPGNLPEASEVKRSLLQAATTRLKSSEAITLEEARDSAPWWDEEGFLIMTTGDKSTQISLASRVARGRPWRWNTQDVVTVSWRNLTTGVNGRVTYRDTRNKEGVEREHPLGIEEFESKVSDEPLSGEKLSNWEKRSGTFTFLQNPNRTATDEELSFLEKEVREGVVDSQATQTTADFYIKAFNMARIGSPRIKSGPEVIETEEAA